MYKHNHIIIAACQPRLWQHKLFWTKESGLCMSIYPSQKMLRVLLVEDSQQYSDLLKDMLAAARKSAFAVHAVANLKQAKDYLKHKTCDVVLLDLNLPDSLGVDSLLRMREVAAGRPIVVLTGNPQSELEEQARRYGAQDFLHKEELQPRVLYRVLRFAVERGEYTRKLEESEALNRRLIEQARDIIFRTDHQGRFSFINPAAETVTEYKQEELLGESFLHIIVPEHRQKVLEHYQNQLNNGIATSYLEFPILTKTGQERWIGQNVWLARQQDGEQVFEAIARDITETKQGLSNLEKSRIQLEERVRQRTRQLETAKLAWERTFDAVPDLIFMTDSNMIITRANRAVSKRTGQPLSKVVGSFCGSVMPGLTGVETSCAFPSFGHNIQAVTQEVHDEVLGGYFLVSTSPLSDENGFPVGHVHVARDITQQKQAERTVREQLSFLQELIDAIPNPIYFKDKAGLYTGCNTAFQRFLGKPLQEILGKDVSMIISPNLSNLFRAKDQELLNNGGIQTYETQVIIEGKPPRDIIYSKAVLRNFSGEVDGLVGVMQDITELRAAENALRTSEEQYRSLFEQAPISIWEENCSLLKTRLRQLEEMGVVDLDEYFQRNPQEIAKCASLIQVVNVNAYTLELFEASSKEALLTNMDQVFSEESLPALKQEILALYRGETSVSVFGYNRTVQGNKLYVLVNVSLAPGSQESWERVLVSIQDLTGRMETESALRESEIRYRTLVEDLNEGLVQVDENAGMRFCNKRFTEMTDYELDELIGVSLFSLLDQENQAKLREQFSSRSQGGRESYELSFLTKHGQPMDTLVSPRPIYDAQGIFRGSYALITDITDRKKLALQLHQSQKMEAIGQLAAGIAHEINTPIQYVASNTDFLKQGFTDLAQLQKRTMVFLAELQNDPDHAGDVRALRKLAEEIDLEFLTEEIPKALEANTEGLERIAVIVRSMREFAHPGHEEKQPVDLNKIIENTVTVARNEWKYVAEVKTDLDPNLPLVSCVSNDIKQAILNIVVNAAQAIAEVVTEGVDQKGTIKISTRQEGPFALISISDTGPGIPPKLVDRIFDPFFTTKEPGKGTGQGLAITYRAVVDTHQGTITVKSPPKQGTTFELRLPIDPNEPRQQS